MSLQQTLIVFEMMDSAYAGGQKVIDLFKNFAGVNAGYQTVTEVGGSANCVRILMPGSKGRSKGGNAPTLGIIGRLRGVGARPFRDWDGF